MASDWVILLVNLGPILIFILLMIIVYIRGKKQNEALLKSFEKTITSGLQQRGISYNKVKIKPDEYEFRCKVKNKSIRVLTLHLKMVNRSFIIQWLVNLLFKEKEKLFLGTKFAGKSGDEDPVYRFDLVPYAKKSFISKRFEHFVDMDDIPTLSKEFDRTFMIKSQSASYVKHLVDNDEIITLVKNNEEFIEHIGLQSSKESTEPHLSATFTFKATKNPPITDFLRLYFLISDAHINNHSSVKKLVAKGKKGKYSTKRGAARRGGSKKAKKKSNKPK